MNEQEHPPAVVVGVDETPAARAALDWAADAAERRGVQLRIVHGLGTPAVMATYAGSESYVVLEEHREYAHTLLTDSATHVHSTRPDLRVTTVLAPEAAPAALLGEACHGDIIVVGSRGLGGVRAIMLGSVSARTSSAAPCPVVVVPEAGRPGGRKGRIVVGVDGSESSRRALRFGLQEALVDGSSVTVVNSWEAPSSQDAEPHRSDEQTFHEDVFDRHSEEIVAGVLAEVVDDETEQLDISAVRMRNHPVEALLKAGEDADLLVVGSRGRGGIRGLVMGSVSQGVLYHARLPVAVLPPHSEEAE